jgi:hypothetical protein
MDENDRKDHDVVRGSSEAAHSELVLSGDFVSPEHLLAANHLSNEEKLAVLDQWEKDIEAASSASPGPEPTAVDDLKRSIETARERLR